MERDINGRFIRGHQNIGGRKSIYGKSISKCSFCFKEFEISIYKLNNGRGKFCSKECCNKSIEKYGGKEIRNCRICGKEFVVKGHNKNNSKKGKFCSKECFYKGRILPHAFKSGISYGPKTRIHSFETIQKMKKGHRESLKKGKFNGNWKGGSGTLRHQEMARFQYKEWRTSVFKRDNYTCQNCNDTHIYLHADHIKDWSNHPELRFDVNNGLTLCYRCHYKKTFPNKEFNEETALKWGVPKRYRKEEMIYF